MENASKSIVFLILVFGALLSAHELFAAAASKESLYDQAIKNVVQIEEHQSICTPGREWSLERNVPIGSGFFLNRYAGEKTHTFLVTARHVVEQRRDVFIPFSGSPGSNEVIFLTLPRSLWRFHPGPNPLNTFPIDVAVMYVGVPPWTVSFRYCLGDCPIDPETNKPGDNQVINPPSPTERALFFGFPLSDVAPENVEPFARSGVVAYTAPNPNLRMDGKPLADDSVYYVDAPSFPGNSGGPVMQELLPLKGEIRLWGLVTGGDRVGRDYTIVTSVERIIETIEHAVSTGLTQNREWGQEPPSLPIRCTPDR